MKAYPISTELRQAIERLFDNPSIAYGSLGADRTDPDEWYESGCDASVPPVSRAAMLRTKLEKFIHQMAQEHEEMGSPEASDTLRMQAIGLLISLRELLAHFPELEGER
jgi:hypothetical protein